MSRSFARLFPRKRADRHPGTGLRRVPGPAEAARRIANVRGLDGAARALADAVQQRVGTGAQADALHGVWLGQPVHPALTGLPVGFWTSRLRWLPGGRDRQPRPAGAGGVVQFGRLAAASSTSGCSRR
jgi:hypothetical protein